MRSKQKFAGVLAALALVLAGCAPAASPSPTVDITPLQVATTAPAATTETATVPATAQTSDPLDTEAVTAAPTTEEATTAPAEEDTTTAPTQESTAVTLQPGETTVPPADEALTLPSEDQVAMGLKNEANALPADAPIVHSATVVPSGELTKSCEDAIIDYSNTDDGYVMVQYTAYTECRLKAQVKGPSSTYTYNLTPQQWAAFPLSDENGTYQITVYKNVEGSKYAAVLSLTVDVILNDEFAPFLHANQYVNFDAAPAAMATADTLCAKLDDFDKVAAVYDFVVKGMSYDTELAATVKSGYLPDLDQVLDKMSGICFDYAALMTGMLRSQGVPCKLVVGYAGDVYHAWINVWTEDTGWIEGLVFFDGLNWQRMDPTFASSADGNQAILDYIGDGSNYSAKYIY